MDDLSGKSVYLSGPMRGVDSLNFPAFARVAKALREQGVAIISPAELDASEGFTPDGPLQAFYLYLKRDFAAIDTCDAIMLIGGYDRAHNRCKTWQDSNGAHAERAYAELHGKAIYEELDHQLHTYRRIA